ncbi:MAG: hypothetical protein GY713_13470, partial [Actinomycetia bacterium]|nr:hypothetical protein [Actinomycetes bacterium]
AEDDLDILGLVVTKEFLSDPVLPGAEVVLRFTIENSSPALAIIIAFFDPLDPEFIPGLTTVAPLPADPCGVGSVLTADDRDDPLGEELKLTGATLAAAGSPGDSCTFDVTLLVPAATPSATYTNTTGFIFAFIGTALVLPEPATDTLTVAGDLLFLEKEFSGDPVAPGGEVTLGFTLTNLDDANPITDITFSDDLDAALAG